MPNTPHHIALPFTLAETAGAPSGAQSPIVYWIAAVLVLAGLCIIGMVVVTALRGRRHGEPLAIATPMPIREAVSIPPPRREPFTPTTQEAQNLLRLMGEAEELCTRLGRDLDDKAQRLERLLARAEGRLGPTQSDDTVVVRPNLTPPSPPSVTTHAPIAPRPEIVTRPMPVPAAVLTYAAAASAPIHSSPSAPAALGLEPLTAQIYSLADAGHAPSAIAQQLGQHTGKVELILALRGA